MLDLEKLNVPPAYQVVSSELRRKILSGRLKPGDPLPSEIELAAMMGVNRSTLREGIRQLESEGLVQREGRKRLLVTVPHHAELAPRTTRALIMQEVTFRELWDVANALEPLSAGLAAKNATEEDVAVASANLDKTEATIEQGRSPGELDLEFHTLISSFAKNRALLLSREPVGLLLYPAFEAIRPQLPQSSKRLLEAHREIILAIKRRDAEHAALWMSKHIYDLKRGWQMANLDLDDRIDPRLALAS